MTRPAVFAAVVSLLLAGVAAGREPVEAPKDELHGAWAVEEIRIDRWDLTGLRGTRYVFSGGVLVTDDRGSIFRSAYRLDPSKTPRAIDFMFLGHNEPQMRGVYRVDGDTLTISTVAGVDESGRPTEAAASEGPTATFTRLRRVRTP